MNSTSTHDSAQLYTLFMVSSHRVALDGIQLLSQGQESKLKHNHATLHSCVFQVLEWLAQDILCVWERGWGKKAGVWERWQENTGELEGVR